MLKEKNSKEIFCDTTDADMNLPKSKILLQYVYVFLLAFLMAVNYEIFILPNSFAPAGLNGIATMIQYKLNFSIGYMSLIINIPLSIVAFFFLNKDYSMKTLLFCLTFSGLLLLFKYKLDLSVYAFNPDGVADSILAALSSGVVNGFIYAYLIKINASSGGTDIISMIIRCQKPHLNLSFIIFILNSFVAFISFFVYDFKYEPVILCVIYSFITGRISDSIIRGGNEQLKFEIITDKPNEISNEIMSKLHHGVTKMKGEGMYSHNEKDLLICIINKHQIYDLQKIIKKYPGSFAYISDVSRTLGNYKKIH